MKFNFDWHIIEIQRIDKRVFVTKNMITLGEYANKLLGNPKKIFIGFDENEKAFALKKSENGFTVNHTQNHHRLFNKNLCERIFELIGENIAKGKRLTFNVLESDDKTYIILKREVAV